MTQDVGAPRTADPRAVRALAEDLWLTQGRRERVLIMRGDPASSWPSEVVVGERQVPVVACVSSLAVRDAIANREDESLLVVVTDVADDELGPSILCDVVRQRSHGADPWSAVRSVFRVTRADGGIQRTLVDQGEAVARVLVADAPPDGWQPPPGGMLTRDHAWQQWAEARLALHERRLDDAGLLEWSLTEPRRGVALGALEPTVREPFMAWLGERVGAAGRGVLQCVRAGNGSDALALGVALSTIAGRAATSAVLARLERHIDGARISADDAAEWGEAAAGWVERRLDGDDEARQRATDVLVRAEVMLVEADGRQFAEASELLWAGLRARQTALAQAIAAASSRAADPAALATVEKSLLGLRAHRLHKTETDRQERLECSVRLLRYLHSVPAQQATTVAQAFAAHSATGAWVDHARQVLWNGDPDPYVAEAARGVLALADARRATEDQAAAVLLADAVSSDRAPGEVLVVEDVLGRVVSPLASADVPVLLLVLDGMSAAAATSLVQDALRGRWVEVVSPLTHSRSWVVAGLPTVTEVSRTSLLTGSRSVGGQIQEREGFTRALGPTATLLHEAAVTGSAGDDVSPHAREVIGDASRTVVGVVLNGIDDALASGDAAATWTVDRVRRLAGVLDRAAAAGRVVVLTSDHGHVVDRRDEGDLRRYDDAESARWRPATTPAGDGEVELRGSRVMRGGGAVVAPWAETIRYTARKEGYHGGVSLAETLIPLVVLRPAVVAEVPGWVDAPDQRPSWWTTPVSAGEALASLDSQGATLFGAHD